MSQINPTLTITGTIGHDNIMNFAGKFADRIMPEMVRQLSLSFLIDELRTEQT